MHARGLTPSLHVVFLMHRKAGSLSLRIGALRIGSHREARDFSDGLSALALEVDPKRLVDLYVADLNMADLHANGSLMPEIASDPMECCG
ncbi:hypothetical protein FYK55_06900 [Roseiconus nitratireducens]|uniref:Uncharacterized protein n=1 Tax=Roseiconus nitratireducens TaxID=2605748 RepID=A0A5M6DJB2_9BACT|nr:hypothetical protein [Roseiconus nitratireducens]KAA5545375.1 hypothetical protein FYK55_06900 [Roseiconus nitratireducens]